MSDGPTTVVATGRGGTLAEYVSVLEKLGYMCALTAGGTQAWVPNARGGLLRIPDDCTGPADPHTLRQLLRKRGVWILTYLYDGDEQHPADGFNYVCRDPDYEIERLSKNARRDIRRGLRSFTVRPCTWDELANKGQPALVDTDARHGYTPPPGDAVQRMARSLSTSPCHECWGAWRDEELVAWIIVVRIDDWAWIQVARSRTEELKGCPNNAVVYALTRQLMVAEKRRYVTYGLSSIQVDVNELAMHKFKVRMGYEACPLCRRFVVYPLLRPLLAAKTLSWGLERLSHRLPTIEKLRKLAGVSRLLSGRQEDPLAWAPQEDGKDD